MFTKSILRKKQIIMGDEFLYFPLPYKLFVVSVNALLILNRDTKGGNLKYMYNLIFNKSLAALSLIEGNYLDNAYPICRLIIELYFKLLII